MESIWTKDVSASRYAALQEDVRTDVLIIGGGMAGILCAHELHKAGIDCVVAESDRIAGGITQNTTAKLTSQHGLIYHKLLERFGPEISALYLKANEDALSRYRSLCKHIPCDFSTQSNFIYSRNDPASLDAELKALSQLGYPATFAGDLPLPFPTVGAVGFQNQAQFHPLKFIAALLPGLRIYERTPVREFRGNTAVTDRGNVHAEQIIVATHFPFLNKHGSYFLKMYQQRSYVIGLENAPPLTGMYLDGTENGLSLRMQGNTLLLGGGGHRTGKSGGNWRELESTAALYYPGCQIRYRWAAQDCMTLDGIPYIGRYSSRTPNLYVATGFNKWGMTGSMVAATILSALIQGKENPYADVFSPSRSMLHPQLGINMLESVKNLMTVSAPRCPHLGCALKWNPRERSWDCPCHGSRFDEKGHLLDNPSTGDLKKP